MTWVIRLYNNRVTAMEPDFYENIEHKISYGMSYKTALIEPITSDS